MTATVQLLCGPAGSGKTGRLLRRYLEVARSGLGQALWLAPNYRTVLSIRERLAHALRGSVVPSAFTFQDFAEEVIRANDPAARPLSHVQRRLLAEDIVTGLHERGELTHFDAVVDTRGFAEGVFALLAELKRNEVWPAAFARAAYRRRQKSGAVARERQGLAILEKDRQCARLYARYQGALVRHRLYDLEGRQWYARDLLGRGLRRPFEGVRAVFVDGFADFTRTQHDMLLTLAQEAEELWITLPDDAGADRAEVFTRPRATLERLGRLRPAVSRPGSSEGDRPAGLRHVERQLFRPVRAVQKSDDAAGVLCLEAPGLVGEVRLVARQVKSLLLAGTPAADVVVTVRDLVPYADLVREVFGEYGIPVDVEGAEPLLRNPAAATLLRAVRLPDDDWPFGPVTALLRSGYFRPDWPETRDAPAVAQHAEVFLRLLGEPRGRAAYLKGADYWADTPPKPREDEQAEESKLRRQHDLAVLCRPFLRRFFAAWDDGPARAPMAGHVTWLRRFAADLGLTSAAAADPRDAAALGRLWDELEDWARLHGEVRGPGARIERSRFQRLLGTVAAGAGLARTPRGPGRVRVLSTDLVRALEIPCLVVMGLGERSFPRLAAPEPFFDEAERQAFRQVGLDLSCAEDRMPDEMLLFYQVVTRATRQLVLSYPAVDDKGQALLPSSFLEALLDCFTPGRVATVRQRMLIEGFDKEAPLCPAEHRVRVAAAARDGGRLVGLPAGLAANLAGAAAMARRRFRDSAFGPYDGLLRQPSALAVLQDLFGPEKVLSPTALEEYVACPFRFFLDHVLRLEPLDEPREDVESTDRGLVFHRALSRLHARLRDEGLDRPVEAVDGLLQQVLGQAVDENVGRLNSPAGEALWRIEGRRLQKRAERYRRDWQAFIALWQGLELSPRPALFEKGFGLPAEPNEEMAEPLVLRQDGVEVRVGGRIDRVDLAEVGGSQFFWIIDYKTGRSSHYTGASLKTFQRLQLTLYALAVERVLLPGAEARPLGLAYWLVTDTGPKVVLPGHPRHHAWFADPERWPEVRRLLEGTVVELVRHLRAGDFPLKPRSEDCTETCSFAQVCRITQARSVDKTWSLPLPTVP